MFTRTKDRQGTPARSASKTSLANIPTTCVQYGLRNAADYRKANGWICTVCMTPPQRHTPSPPPSPAHHARQDVQHTTVECQWYHRQQTDGTKHLPRGARRQSGGHSGVQAHIQNYTLARQGRR